MRNEKSQRFVYGKNNSYNNQQSDMKLPLTYVLTGIAVLVLSLVPIIGSAVLIVWGAQVVGDTPFMGVILILLGIALIIVLVFGTIIFGINYFTNDSEKKLREIKYKEKDKFEEIFTRCEHCGALILIGSEKCGKCGYIVITDEEKENEFNKLRTYFKEQYNFEISDKNMAIINSYFHSQIKTFDYSKGNSDREITTDTNIQVKEGMLNVFLFNFKKIIVVCSILMVCLFFAFVIFGKYLAGM